MKHEVWRSHDGASLPDGSMFVEEGEFVCEAVASVGEAEQAEAVGRLHGQQVGDPE